MEALLRIPVYLILVMAVLITLLPLGWVISTSLKPGNEIFANPPYWIPKKATIVNYYHVLFESEIPVSYTHLAVKGHQLYLYSDAACLGN